MSDGVVSSKRLRQELDRKIRCRYCFCASPATSFLSQNVALSLFATLNRIKRQIELIWFQKPTSSTVHPYEVPVPRLESLQLGLGLTSSLCCQVGLESARILKHSPAKDLLIGGEPTPKLKREAYSIRAAQ